MAWSEDFPRCPLHREFRKRLGHLAPGSALGQGGPLSLGGGRPRSLDLQQLRDGPRASPLRADAIQATNGVRNTAGAGSGEDHVVRSRSVFNTNLT